MKRSLWGFIAMGCALALAACTPATVATGGPAPPGASAPVEAPAGKLALLKGTYVDDEAIRTAWLTLRATASVSAAMRGLGLVKAGTPTANTIADGLDGVRRWLNVATEAQQLGQSENAFAAWQQAESAYVSVLRAMGNSR